MYTLVLISIVARSIARWDNVFLGINVSKNRSCVNMECLNSTNPSSPFSDSVPPCKNGPHYLLVESSGSGVFYRFLLVDLLDIFDELIHHHVLRKLARLYLQLKKALSNRPFYEILYWICVIPNLLFFRSL